jgi:hypothetical protein
MNGVLDADEAVAGDCIADVDADTNLILVEELNRRGRARFRQTHFFTAKINGALSENHQFQISGFGNRAPSTATSTAWPATRRPRCTRPATAPTTSR